MGKSSLGGGLAAEPQGEKKDLSPEANEALVTSVPQGNWTVPKA